MRGTSMQNGAYLDWDELKRSPFSHSQHSSLSLSFSSPSFQFLSFNGDLEAWQVIKKEELHLLHLLHLLLWFSWSFKLEKISRVLKRATSKWFEWLLEFPVVVQWFECFLHKKLIRILLNGLVLGVRFKRGFQVGDFHLKFKLAKEVLAN